MASLPNYTNFCYPTQLCLNSEANIVPYVGYFNEGLYALASNSGLSKPLYEYTLSGKPEVRKDAANKSTYCADIYERYAEYTNDDSDLIEQYSREHILEDIAQSGSFRLGPNNKSTYLFGGMFGLNNGYCRNIGYAGKFIFDNNFVGIAGGIAGRQARGSIKNAYSMPEFSFTSGAFDDVVTIQSNVDDSIDLVGVFVSVANLIPTAQLPLAVNTDSTLFYEIEIKDEEGHKQIVVSSDSLTGVVTNIKNDHPTCNLNNAVYVTDISAKDGLYTGNKVTDVVTSARVFKLDNFDNIVSKEESQIVLESEQFANYTKDGSITADSYITKINFFDCYFTYSNQIPDIFKNIRIWSSDTSVFSSISNANKTIQLVTPVSRVDFDITTVLSDTASARSTVSLMITSTNIDSNIDNVWIDNNFTRYYNKLLVTATSAINVKLAPLIHAGGFCGEYVATDTTEKSFSVYDKRKNGTNADVLVFDNTKFSDVYSQVAWTTDLPDNVSDRQYDSYNTIASFAADISLDTMNKSNCDSMSAYPYTSADSQRVTKFWNVFCNLHADKMNPSWNKFVTPSDFVRYMNYTPDAMPAVIVSEPHGLKHDSDGGKTYEPNFGITWLDQLFFKGNAYAHKTGELTDAFVNSFAQARMSSAVDTNVIDAWEHHRHLYDTYFKFDYGNPEVYAAHSAEITSYVTRQSDVGLSDDENLIDTPYQYTQGRIGYIPELVSAYEGYSYRTNDTRPYYISTIAKICSATNEDNDDASAKVADLIKSIDDSKRNYAPAYVYTYDSTVASYMLPVVPLTIQYTDQYAYDKDLGTARPIESYPYINCALSAKSNKAYALASNSYRAIYEANNDNILPVFMNNDVPLSSNDLVFGFVPNSADILKCLNQSVSTDLYCSGISASDLQYMLVVDSDKHVIFDTKLDITAANNDGYVIEFDGIRSVSPYNGYRNKYTASDLSGLAINIKVSGTR